MFGRSIRSSLLRCAVSSKQNRDMGAARCRRRDHLHGPQLAQFSSLNRQTIDHTPGYRVSCSPLFSCQLSHQDMSSIWLRKAFRFHSKYSKILSNIASQAILPLYSNVFRRFSDGRVPCPCRKRRELVISCTLHESRGILNEISPARGYCSSILLSPSDPTNRSI